MNIESFKETSVYLEQKSLINILGSSTKNNEGIIEKDEVDNSLISKIDSGDTYLNRVRVYTGSKGLLLYNSTTNKYEIAKQNDELDIPLDFEKGLKYYLESEIVEGNLTNYSEFKFTLDKPIKNIFKIFLDGYEITKYNIGTKDENNEFTEIFVTSTQTIRVDEFSEISVIAYETTTPTIDLNFELNYYGYNTIWEYDAFSEPTYFNSESFIGERLETIQNLSTSQNIVSTSKTKPFSNRPENIINKVDNTLSITIFNFATVADFVHYIKNNKFRIILNNEYYGKTVLLNDCKIDKGYSIEFGDIVNKKLTIPFGNIIEIDYSTEDTFYGSGLYGKGLYGTNTSVINSNRGGL